MKQLELHNMQGVVAQLVGAKGILESDVPYAKDGECPGEHEAWEFKNKLEALIEEGSRIGVEFGV